MRKSVFRLTQETTKAITKVIASRHKAFGEEPPEDAAFDYANAAINHLIQHGFIKVVNGAFDFEAETFSLI